MPTMSVVPPRISPPRLPTKIVPGRTSRADEARRRLRDGARATRTGARATARATKTGAEVAWSTLNFMREVAPRERRRKPSKARTAPEVAAAALAGAGAEFLFDPADGKRRRKMLIDRTRATFRHFGARAAQQASYTQGKVTGAVHQATSRPSAPADDQALADRVRTEIFRDADAPKGAVSVGVVDGIVYLRGEIADRSQIERLVAGAQSVQGVRAVENLLHTPETPAPMGGRA